MAEGKVLVNKKDFKAFEKVRVSGITNMFDINAVMSFSGLTKEKCLTIMKYYTELKEKYKEKG